MAEDCPTKTKAKALIEPAQGKEVGRAKGRMVLATMAVWRRKLRHTLFEGGCPMRPHLLNQCIMQPDEARDLIASTWMEEGTTRWAVGIDTI
jgi:hypothetical protein